MLTPLGLPITHKSSPDGAIFGDSTLSSWPFVPLVTFHMFHTHVLALT